MNLIEKNQFLDKMREGRPALGCQLRSGSSRLAELMGWCGFDFVFIDSEHYTCDVTQAEYLFAACELSGSVPLIRIPSLDRSLIKQYLDAGAGGIIVPHVDTPQQAAELIEAGKYAPVGHRGFTGNGRAARYGYVDREQYSRLANRNTSMIAMIESVKGVENIDAILKENIDMIQIGPSDIAMSMGFDGRTNHTEVQQAVDYIISRCKSAGVRVGGSADSVEAVEKQFKRGFDYVHFASDMTVLKRTWDQTLQTLRERGFR